MRITDDVRQYAEAQGLEERNAVEAGLQAKAAEFREKGGELYLDARQ